MHLGAPYLSIRLNLIIKKKKKKKLVQVGIVDDVGGLACILYCRVSYLPMNYLGLSLGASYKAKLI
jgi:hypothetical protein